MVIASVAMSIVIALHWYPHIKSALLEIRTASSECIAVNSNARRYCNDQVRLDLKKDVCC